MAGIKPGDIIRVVLEPSKSPDFPFIARAPDGRIILFPYDRKTDAKVWDTAYVLVVSVKPNYIVGKVHEVVKKTDDYSKGEAELKLVIYGGYGNMAFAIPIELSRKLEKFHGRKFRVRWELIE